MTIRGKHNLEDEPNASEPEAARDKKWSRYCYLFTELANLRESSLFPGTDDQGTLQRLLDFETACHMPYGHDTLPGLTIPVPAAYTYFGQFMNHDISAPVGTAGGDPPVGIIGNLDPAGLTKDWRAQKVSPILERFVNKHENPLTLASLYGDGPESDHEEIRDLYNPDATFKLGQTVKLPREFFEGQKKDPDSIDHVCGAHDIPRGLRPAAAASGTARQQTPATVRKPLIADERNDGNLILSQLHLAFMHFHNKAVKALGRPGDKPGKVFAEARQLVTLHYHWLILNDFLPALLSKAVLDKPLSQWRSKLNLPPEQRGSVPMEFTTAAFRFGHSMVGRAYDYNANFGENGRIDNTGANLQQLFEFTSHGGMGNSDDQRLQLPSHWVIDWERLTRPFSPGAPPRKVPGQAEGIDFDIAPDMLMHAGNADHENHASILFRNLVRGFHRRIPFGQKLAEACGQSPLSAKEIEEVLPGSDTLQETSFSDLRPAARELGILTDTPAWLYFLYEAKSIEKGERVGPTASTIIAETIVGLMRHNPGSLLNHRGGGWHPSESKLKSREGKPLASIRAFLLFATEDNPRRCPDR